MKNITLKKVTFIILLFIIGSFIGFIHENVLNLLQGYFILRKGLIYEPLIPIYGMGLVILYIAYSCTDFTSEEKWKEYLKVFIFGFFLGGFTEYLGSLLQEKIFGTISWNYSDILWNIYGRTSFFHAVFWGLAGLLFYKWLLPLIRIMEREMDKKGVNIFAMILSAIFIMDCLISFAACYRVTERRQSIEPESFIDYFLDKYYPDEFIENIYNNARVPK